MLEGLTENLRSVFDGEDPAIITDDPDIADWLTTRGVPAISFGALLAGHCERPQCAAILPLNYDRLPSRETLRRIFSATRVLWIPLASFSSDLGTAKYAIELFADLDLPRTVAMNRRVITRLLLASDEVTMSGPDTDLRLRLPDALQVTSRTRLGLLADEHSTVGNYFEVGMSPTDLSGRVDEAMSISGTFRIDSVLVAKHRELKGPRAHLFPEAAQIADEMRRACPMQIVIRDNRIVDGLGHWAAGVDAMSGPEYRGAVTEIAVGTAGMPLDRVDWSLNCLVNEGAAGVHVGVGNGLTGVHFDFISKEAQIDGL